MNIKSTSLTLFFCFLFFMNFSGLAQKVSVEGVDGVPKKWHKVTLTLHDGPQSDENADVNPFTDYQLNVTFTHEKSDTKYTVPGYFAADGNSANTSATKGSVWKAHLSPDLTGKWNYEISFLTGKNIAVSSNESSTKVTPFHSLNGSFTVIDSDKKGKDLRAKGRLEYIGERYLQFKESGKYFLKQGPDAPENLLAYSEFDGDFKTDGHKDQFIKTWSAHVKDWQDGDPTWQNGKGKGLIGAVNYLSSKGMNVFSFLTMNIAGDDRNVFPYTNYDERLRMDCSKLEQWEILFEHSQKLGMYLHFKTQETENDQLLDKGKLGIERKLYYRELIARFSHNLALNWNLGEETTNSASENISFAEYFFKNDPYKHNIVLHTYPNQQEKRYMPMLGDKSKLTGLSIQTSKADFSNVFKNVKKWVNESKKAGKNWVVACDEPGDAKLSLVPDTDDPEHNVPRNRALWGTLLAGGAGNEWYFGYKRAHSDLTCQDFRSRDIWWDQCRYALDFFEVNNIPFWKMANDNSLVANPKDEVDKGYCFAQKGKHYVSYFKDVKNKTLDLTKTTGLFHVKWFNPRNGGVLQLGSITQVEGGTLASLGNPPNDGNKDWVIYVYKTK
ncbi:MAG: DUF5060 domain-containing protein [Lentisphaeraceae bacterium]|nr:DUF5060 domain-containing protein [Lentisphaeraceae bacterium]